ncbi:MAG: T9SS type A sorting domain-containing protein [Bacteroidia bacterium]|nr:T9SS type A sorting domain-containing protein [Bacteroidia bacterium]
MIFYRLIPFIGRKIQFSIYLRTALAGKQTIDLKNQNNGLYFMNLQQDGKQQTIKVIKN